MTRPKILVTSAAGHTGAAAVRELLQKGFPVRAFVRRRDARSQALEDAGARIMIRSSGLIARMRCTICSVDCRAMGLPQLGQWGAPIEE